MSFIRRSIELLTSLCIALAVTSALVYVSVFYILRLHTLACIGGGIGWDPILFRQAKSTQPFVEYQITKDVGYVFAVQRLLHEVTTRYQHIQVYSHRFFGNILVIDGSLQITQHDEVNYHEMTVHVPLAYLPDAKKALVIGGGDGGALLRILQHNNIKEAHLVDIDMYAMRDVVASYFPYLYTAYTDVRTKAFAYDGRLWVDEQLEMEENKKSYDVVVLDSTDYGASESLFTKEFYIELKKLMAEESILVANVDSPSWNMEIVSGVHNQLSSIFNYCFVYQSHQPTFLSGHYSYAFCSDTIHPMKTPISWEKWQAKNIYTYYYNEDVHYGSFMLPERVRRELSVGVQLNELKENAFTKRKFTQSISIPQRTRVAEANEAEAREDD